MSKPAKPTYQQRAAFLKTDKLTIQMHETDGYITHFTVNDKIVTVKNHNILAAWKQVEKLTEKL